MAFAHVPYIEGKDYPEGPGGMVRDVDQSKAFDLGDESLHLAGLELAR